MFGMKLNAFSSINKPTEEEIMEPNQKPRRNSARKLSSAMKGDIISNGRNTTNKPSKTKTKVRLSPSKQEVQRSVSTEQMDLQNSESSLETSHTSLSSATDLLFPHNNSFGSLSSIDEFKQNNIGSTSSSISSFHDSFDSDELLKEVSEIEKELKEKESSSSKQRRPSAIKRESSLAKQSRRKARQQTAAADDDATTPHEQQHSNRMSTTTWKEQYKSPTTTKATTSSMSISLKSHAHAVSPSSSLKLSNRRPSHVARASSAGAAANSFTTTATPTPSYANNPRKQREKNMRANLIQNKRKLEQELNQSEIFQFVLHKCPLDKFVSEQQQQLWSASAPGNLDVHAAPTTPRSSRPKKMQETSSSAAAASDDDNGGQHPRMPLDKFLQMKLASERSRLEGQCEEDGDTWQLCSLAYSKSGRAIDVKKDSSSGDASSWVLPPPTQVVKRKLKVAKQQQPAQQPTHLPARNVIQDDCSEYEEDLKCDTDDENDDIDDTDDDDESLSMHDVTQSSSDNEDEESSDAENSLASKTEAPVFDDPQTLSLSEADFCENFCGEDGGASATSSDSKDRLNVTNMEVVDRSTGRNCRYTGQLSKSSGTPCGHGRLEYLDQNGAGGGGDILEGQFVHGLWTGYGQCRSQKTGQVYTGYFLADQMLRHGHGICIYPDGRHFDGTYSHGSKVEGKMTYTDKSVYLGQWQSGARHGRGTYTFPNGLIYHGEFVQDQFCGEGIMTWTSGSRFVGGWKNGARHGHGREFRADGTIRQEGTWKNGKRVERATIVSPRKSKSII
jgi:hypothetical protein